MQMTNKKELFRFQKNNYTIFLLFFVTNSKSTTSFFLFIGILQRQTDVPKVQVLYSSYTQNQQHQYKRQQQPTTPIGLSLLLTWGCPSGGRVAWISFHAVLALCIRGPAASDIVLLDTTRLAVRMVLLITVMVMEKKDEFFWCLLLLLCCCCCCCREERDFIWWEVLLVCKVCM